MKITIDLDEKELLAGMIESLLSSDKPAMKHVLRSIVKELFLSIDRQTAKLIAERYVEIEREINFQASSKQ